jgi:superfamily I DNA/RNA helicase
MTIHASKGLEFKNVFFVGFEDGLVPLTRQVDIECVNQFLGGSLTNETHNLKSKIAIPCVLMKMQEKWNVKIRGRGREASLLCW